MKHVELARLLPPTFTVSLYSVEINTFLLLNHHLLGFLLDEQCCQCLDGVAFVKSCLKANSSWHLQLVFTYGCSLLICHRLTFLATWATACRIWSYLIITNNALPRCSISHTSIVNQALRASFAWLLRCLGRNGSWIWYVLLIHTWTLVWHSKWTMPIWSLEI